MICDGSREVSKCQRQVDDIASQAAEGIEDMKGCCPASARKRSEDGWLSSITRLFGRQSSGGGSRSACPTPTQDPRQPPTGQCYATYTYTAGLFPNVCGNAKSAIDRRGKTSVLTYQVGNRNLLSRGAVQPWYDGHFRSPAGSTPQAGWGLEDCEVEEYPWGNGNPTQINNDDFDSQAVLRLIPGGSTTDQGNGENGAHGRHVYAWAQSIARQYNQAAANDPNANLFPVNRGQISPAGLVYCVGFESGFTADLPEDSLNNRCARPYGTAFTLVNWVETNRASGTVSYRWDPWFDAVPGRKQRQVVNVDSSGNELTALIPPIYCQYPSPGALDYNRVNDLYTLAPRYQ